MIHRPESEDAWRRIQGSIQAQYRRIMTLASQAGPKGMTCDELEVRLGGRHQTVSARCSELRGFKSLLDSGRQRRTRSGSMACVYVTNAAWVKPDVPPQGELFA